MELLAGVDLLILDCLRDKPHPTHLSVNEALEIATRINASKTVFTHLSHDLGHQEFSNRLPSGFSPAFDGLQLHV